MGKSKKGQDSEEAHGSGGDVSDVRNTQSDSRRQRDELMRDTTGKEVRRSF